MTSPSNTNENNQAGAVPPVVDQAAWEAALDQLRAREKAATRELDAIAAARRRLPMVELPDYRLDGPEGPVRLVDVFDGKRQLIVYNHMWFPGEEWQCGGCTGFTSQFTRLEFLDAYDARFVIVTQGPIDDALAYKARVGNRMDWYSTANSPFGSDMGAPPAGGFQLNVFLRIGDKAYRTYNTQGRGVEQVSHTFPLVDLLPYGRQEEWQDSPPGWPQSPTYSRWAPSEDYARYAGSPADPPSPRPQPPTTGPAYARSENVPDASMKIPGPAQPEPWSASPPPSRVQVKAPSTPRAESALSSTVHDLGGYTSANLGNVSAGLGPVRPWGSIWT